MARGVINLDAEYGDPNRRGLNRSHEEKLAMVRDAVGDIFYHLLVISIAYGIDLQNAFQSSMRSITQRYPAVSVGSSK